MLACPEPAAAVNGHPGGMSGTNAVAAQQAYITYIRTENFDCACMTVETRTRYGRGIGQGLQPRSVSNGQP